MNNEKWVLADAVVTGSNQTVIRKGAVGFRAGKITRVTTQESLTTEQIRHSTDYGDSTLAPGFIDAHVHLLFSCDTDHEKTRQRFTQASDAELASVGARNALECLLGGVTTVRDLGDTRWIVREIRDSIAQGILVGPKILTSGAPLTTPQGHLNWCGNVATTEQDVQPLVSKLIDNGADVIKIMSSGGNMTRESDPLLPQFSLAALKAAVSRAHASRIPVASHAQNASAIRDCIAAGVDTLEHCLWRDEQGLQQPTADLINQLKSSKSTVVITLAGIARALLPDAQGFSATEKQDALKISPTGQLNKDFYWAQEVMSAGLPVVVASDAGVRFTPFRYFLDTIRAAMLALDISPVEAIESVTSVAAKALGLQESIGTIAPGLQADFTVLNTSAIAQRIGEVRCVYRGGNKVVDQGKIVLDELQRIS